MSEEAIEQVAQPEAAPLETPAEVAQGGSGHDFLNMIPEELRDHPSLNPIRDVGNLARSYVNAQRLIGADKLPMPMNPTDEDLDNIYGRLGRPETPEGYEVTADGNIVTEEIANDFKGVAHQLRLTPDQASGILEYYKSMSEGSVAKMQHSEQEYQQQVQTELKQEWGEAYESKIQSAANAFQEFSSPEVLEMQLADGTKVGNHPDFIKAFANIASFRHSVTSEDTVSDSTQAGFMSKNAAQAEINSIMTSPVYTDSKNVVGRQQAIDRVQELMTYIHG
jgi:hypothetical protein